MGSWLRTWWSTVRLRHLALEMLVALSLAFLIWLYTHSRDQNTLDHVSIPVQVQLAPSFRELYILETGGNLRLTASFSGPASRIRELRRKLQRSLVQVNVTLTVPDEHLQENTFTQTIRVEPAQVPVPPGVFVDIAEDSNNLPVTLHRLAERILPVRFDYTGDVRVSQLKLEPSTVLVRGPKALLDRAQAIHTQPHALTVPAENPSENSPTVRGQADLVAEVEGRPILANPRQVSFRCVVQPRQRIYDIADVPVQFLCPPAFPWQVRFPGDKQARISVRLLGPASEDPPPVLAFVDLTGKNLGRGRNLEPVRVQFPKEFTLVQNQTPLVAFQLEEPERPETTLQLLEPATPAQ